MISKPCSHPQSVQEGIGIQEELIVFSFGIDASVLVSEWQVSSSYGKIVGGSHKNYYLYVRNKTEDEVTFAIK